MLSSPGLAWTLCLVDSGLEGCLYDKASFKIAFIILVANDSQLCPIGVALIISVFVCEDLHELTQL